MQNTSKSVPRRVSAAHISVPGRPVTAMVGARSPARPSNAARFARLEGLRDRIGRHGNQNDLAIALISAAISEGIRSGRDVVGTVAALGLDPRHVGAVLRREAGTNPTLHRWRKGENGRYRLLN